VADDGVGTGGDDVLALGNLNCCNTVGVGPEHETEADVKRRNAAQRPAAYDQGQPETARIWHILRCRGRAGQSCRMRRMDGGAAGKRRIVEGEAHIRHFATHPDLVRRGVGANLLARCFSDARHLSIRKLIVFSTLGAERFLRGIRFQEDRAD
jgi:GNAT superfamily N-acetyltransferase